MKKIFVLMLVLSSLSSCTIVDYAYYNNYVYVNNSGVEVAIVGKNDRYSDVPDSLVLANGESYVIRGISEGPDPYGSDLGETNTVKVYFNKKTLVIHDINSYKYNVRDIRDLFNYSYVNKDKYSSDATYIFTAEDYELALKLQE